MAQTVVNAHSPFEMGSARRDRDAVKLGDARSTRRWTLTTKRGPWMVPATRASRHTRNILGTEQRIAEMLAGEGVEPLSDVGVVIARGSWPRSIARPYDITHTEARVLTGFYEPAEDGIAGDEMFLLARRWWSARSRPEYMRHVFAHEYGHCLLKVLPARLRRSTADPVAGKVCLNEKGATGTTGSTPEALYEDSGSGEEVLAELFAFESDRRGGGGALPPLVQRLCAPSVEEMAETATAFRSLDDLMTNPLDGSVGSLRARPGMAHYARAEVLTEFVRAVCDVAQVGYHEVVIRTCHELAEHPEADHLCCLMSVVQGHQRLNPRGQSFQKMFQGWLSTLEASRQHQSPQSGGGWIEARPVPSEAYASTRSIAV